jgi:outer membrane lipoprotein-sorting protein
MKFFRFPAVLILLFLALPAFAQKLKPEEIIAKHLDSIGTAEARAAATSRMIIGDVLITFVTQKNQTTQGRVVMASEGKKSLVGMTLNANDYTNEKFSSDGSKAKVGYAYLSRYSPLGDFVQSNNAILSQGIFGGALSTAWTALRTDAKFSGGGKKKIDGNEAYVLSYSTKGGGDITLFFDAATFRHIRTEYKTMQSAGIGLRPEQSSGYDETRIKLVEDFSDFRDEKGLMLPHTYKLNYSVSGQKGTTEIQWALILSSFTANPKLDANTFDQ